MNGLVRLYLEREAKRAEMRELRKLATEVREAQRQARPEIERARALRKARLRQDGPRGFVMIGGVDS